jgi:hypothetical protein
MDRSTDIPRPLPDEREDCYRLGLMDALKLAHRLMNAYGADVTTDDESAAYREMYDLLEAQGFDMSDVTPYE